MCPWVSIATGYSTSTVPFPPIATHRAMAQSTSVNYQALPASVVDAMPKPCTRIEFDLMRRRKTKSIQGLPASQAEIERQEARYTTV